MFHLVSVLWLHSKIWEYVALNTQLKLQRVIFPRCHWRLLLLISTCLDFLELGAGSVHTILLQTDRFCFPNLLCSGSIQCDKIHASAAPIHSKWSTESRKSSSTVLQFCPTRLSEIDPSIWISLYTTHWAGLFLHWLYNKRQEFADSYYRNYAAVRKTQRQHAAIWIFYRGLLHRCGTEQLFS